MSVVVPNFILFLLVLFVAVVVVVIVVVTRSASHNPAPPIPWSPQALPNPAVAELDLRYARGEIEREDYLRRRGDLLGQSVPLPPVPPPEPDTNASQ